ncbi:MAG: hypothetical protein U5L96_20610 [Owenweeksia sp.]|nr:hypothetical protein [Owenweeksia sp.]
MGGTGHSDQQPGTDYEWAYPISPNKAYYLKSFQNISARTTTAQKIVPLNAGLWTAFTFDNAGQYYRNYRQYLEDDGRLRKHDQILEKLNLNAEELLMEWVDTEMGLFATAGKDGHANQVAYLSYRDEETARKKLDLMADSDFIDGYRGVIIKKMASENALPRFYGPVFQGFHFPYFFVSDGFVIFSENPAMLKGVINDLLDGKTLVCQ